jgi:hypothetical protein
MREETKKRREKKEKIKKEFDKIKKEKGISKKMTKQEENQVLLAVLKQKDSNEIEQETIEQKQERRRSYTCSCGYHVVLEGEIYKRKIKDGFELCSKCAE